MTKQLTLRFNVTRRLPPACGAVPPYSEYHDFAGPIRLHDYKPGRFQYRYGRKQQPKDEYGQAD